MIRNLLLTAWRRCIKNKFFTLLNIVGLGIGMVVFLLIALYVQFERSYEDFIPGKENIYRVKLESWLNHERVSASAENYPGAGPALKSELPEVVSYARLLNMGYKNNVIITYKDAKPEPIVFKHRRFLYADSAFLPMMGYTMVKGNARTALSEPLTAVISEKYATLYFKHDNPIGKTLILQDDDSNHEPAIVTGVFKDLPDNTHLKFDVLFSYSTLLVRGDWAREDFNTGWGRNQMYTFIQLRPGTDPKTIEARLPALINKYKPELKQSGQKDVLLLQPLKNIHLTSELAEEAENNGSARIVFFMSVIGLFVLVIAWINYINLSTARAVERAKEVGVRKVIGAYKRQLISQFLAEAALVNLFSVIMAFLLVATALPWFNRLSGLSLSYSSLYQSWFQITLLLLWVAGTFFSGGYPSLVLSSFKPLAVLKGSLQHSSRGILLRQGLVVVQFVASIVLIAGTIVIYRQLHYVMHRDLGMNIDQVMVMDVPGIVPKDRPAHYSSKDLFRNELKNSPSVAAVSLSLTVPGKLREYKTMIHRAGVPNSDSVVIRVNSSDYDFMNVYKMKMIAGRRFSPDHPGDAKNSAIVTESTARLLGYTKVEDIIGQSISIPQLDDSKRVIVGVVNDYHQLSLKKTIDPGLFICDLYWGEMYSVRIRTQNISKAVEDIRQVWTKAFPGNPFDYSFLDEYFNRQYTNERKFGNLFTTFALLAILIGCLGLFGLSAYTASQRMKEIGIRKVLGASVTDITTLLSKDLIKLVMIAVVLAIPIAWFIMDNWLKEFAYRIHLTWWMFALAGLCALLIAMITVSFQAIKTAIANPVNSLRTE
jgi:putative ABC transport system permease protein